MNTARAMTVARTDLRQLWQSKDFWVPMVALGAIFFLVVPAILLTVIDNVGNIDTANQMAEAIDALPETAAQGIDDTLGADAAPQQKVALALALYLLAPIVVIVPLTISSAIGASSIVGERERGTGEFLAHSPASAREIYLGKLLASFVPGYLTTLGGFGVYALLVNSIIAPDAGKIVFPTGPWWLLILWVLPAFLLLALSIILRLSARVRSTAAAQQAAGLVTFPLIILGYVQSTGALFGSDVVLWTFILGGIAWLIALVSLLTGMRSVRRAGLLGVANEQ